MADPDNQIRGGGRSSRPCDKGDAGSQKKKTIFRPFGPQFGLNIRGRAPRIPPLYPPLRVVALGCVSTKIEPVSCHKAENVPRGQTRKMCKN